jgi:MFS family permease
VLLGGALTSGLGWEWVLWVNVPIGLIAAAIAPRLMAESRSEQRRQFDVTSVSRAQMRLGQLPADQPASA